MITRQLQQCANDLADVEAALVAIYNRINRGIVAALFPADRFVKPVVAKELIPDRLKRPHLPRCSEFSVANGRECREAASYPRGLCPSHWLKLFGHTIVRDTCLCCGLKIPPHADLTGTMKQRFEIERRRREVLKQRCPSKILSERARVIMESTAA